MAFLLSPALRAHPPPPTHNLYAVALPQVPRNRAEGTDRITAVAPVDRGPHLKGGVCSGVVAMVNMPSNKQQRIKEPKSPHYIPLQNSHWLWKKSVLPIA